MQERVFKRKVLDANILKEMHANNVCYSKHSKDRFIPFRFDKFGYVECKLFKKILNFSSNTTFFGGTGCKKLMELLSEIIIDSRSSKIALNRHYALTRLQWCDRTLRHNLQILEEIGFLNDLVLATIKRNAPSPYKEAGFVKLLENKGIGRPSTYASCLPTLLKREYISISQDKKHTITPTHKGKRVVEVFENAYQFIIDLTYTKQMEEVLDEIIENKSSYLDFLQNLATKCPKIEKLERNDDEIKPSSEGQITYIENILRDLQLDLSEEFKNYKEDNRIAKAFLDRYIKEHEFFEKNNKKASSSNNNEIRPATPKQINFAEILAKKHNVRLPKGFKYSMKVCGDFINEYHKK